MNWADLEEEERRRESWIIVTNKLTYLLLVAVACCVLWLIRDLVQIFYLHEKELMYFFGDLYVCGMISGVCIRFFVGLNSYSAVDNPDHPKPGDKIVKE